MTEDMTIIGLSGGQGDLGKGEAGAGRAVCGRLFYQ